MALRESGLTGTNVRETCERQTGLLMQPPDSMTQERDGTTLTAIPTAVGAADSKDSNVEFGIPFVIHVGISAGDDGGADQTHNVRVFGTSGAPWKFRVLDTWAHLLSDIVETHTLEIFHYTLDTAGALDTANAMTDEVTLNQDTSDLMTLGRVEDTSKLIEAYAVVDTGEEIVLQVKNDGGAATNSEQLSVKMLCMRVN
ncbi:hypothetical protein LCGC14_1797250 [marine sediment metagenome]|uniref:Uncharacterized protein n=1 Tax=marine sediment metagenome TaxID=412755 RepID=A0A0F9HDD8_9ZZZZ